MVGSQSQHHWDAIDELVSEVAARRGVDLEELPSLFEVVDPDALERLVDSAATSDLAIELPYAGYRITVDGDGTVTLSESNGPVVAEEV